MPYDPAKTRELAQMLNAFANFPTGDHITNLTKQLLAADAEIGQSSTTIARAQADQQQAERSLSATIEASRRESEKLKEELSEVYARNTALTTALTKIAADSRGAKKLATDALKLAEEKK